MIPAHTVSILPTNNAPTMTTAIAPISVSKIAATRSLRANKRGMPRTLSALTLNKRPGT